MKDKVRMMTALTFLIAALAMPLVSSVSYTHLTLPTIYSV